MRSDVILVANKGQSVPPSVVEAALANNTSAHGIAFVHPKDGLYGTGDVGVPSQEDLTTNMDALKDTVRIYHLCESVGEVQDEDLQPYPLILDGANPVCLGCLAGDFEVESNDGQLSNTTVFIKETLSPMLQAMWFQAKQDIHQLSELMNKKSFRANLEGQCASNKGTIVLLLSSGEHFIFSKSDAKMEGPWGFTSDKYNLQEGSFPAKVEEVKAAAPPAPRRVIGAARATVPPVPPKVEEPVVPAPGAPVVKADPPVAPVASRIGAASAINKGPVTSDLLPKTATTSTAKLVWAQPPADMKVKKLQQWYYKNNNTLVPENFRERPPIQMPEEKALKMSTVKIVPKDDKVYKAFSEMPKPAPAQGDTVQPAREPEHLPKPQLAGPIVGVAELKKVDDLLQNSKKVMDPNEWQTLENKNPTFADAHGLSLERAMHLTLEVREAICRVSPLDAARGWMNADWRCRQLMDKLAALQAKKPVEEEVKAVAAEQPTKPRRVIGAAAKAA
jgi:hypothetical protein